MPDIKLTRKAGELREGAQTELKELRERVEKQYAGELAEGESKLSPEEIAEATQSIEDKFVEAKSIEKMNSLEGLAERAASGTDVSDGVKQILAQAGFAPNTDENEPVFKSVGDFFRAVRAAQGNYPSKTLTQAERAKLSELAAGATAQELGDQWSEKIVGKAEAEKAFEQKDLAGDDTAAALVPTIHMTELLRTMGEQQQFAQRARHVPMARRTIDFPRLIQTDATDTRPFFGFAAITKIGEGVQKPVHEPAFEQFTLTAVKYAAYVEATDELLAESIVGVPPILTGLLTDAIAYEYDRDLMRGSGSSEPQGFIGSAAEWQQNRIAVVDVQLGDIFGMEERFFGTGGIYLHHPSVIPDLYGLAVSNIIVWNADLATDVPGTLLGRPLVKTHKLPALGTAGDFCLVDPSFYLAGDLQSITIANSTHFQFRNDLTAWRAVFRGAGSPWPAGLFSTEASGGLMTYRVSPFVTLSDVAAS